MPSGRRLIPEGGDVKKKSAARKGGKSRPSLWKGSKKKSKK
jgi:hypothetical protein